MHTTRAFEYDFIQLSHLGTWARVHPSLMLLPFDLNAYLRPLHTQSCPQIVPTWNHHLGLK